MFIVECPPGEEDVPAGAAEVYLGERFCPTRFLQTLPEYRARAQRARAAGARPFISTPVIVPEREFNRIAEAIQDALVDFDGIQGYDPGLLARFAGKTRLTYFGLISSARQVSVLREEFGIERFRPHPASINVLSELGDPGCFEIMVHGSIAIGANPRCLTRMYRGCELCGESLTLEHAVSAMVIDGSTYRSTQDASILPHLDLLESHGFGKFVIDGFGKSVATVEDLLARLASGWRPAPDRENTINGYFVNRGPTMLESLAWSRYHEDLPERLRALGSPASGGPTLGQ